MTCEICGAETDEGRHWDEETTKFLKGYWGASQVEALKIHSDWQTATSCMLEYHRKENLKKKEAV